MKLSLFFAFTLLITLQLASSTSSYQPLKSKWVFSRLLEFNNSACCAFSNLTFSPDPTSNRDDLFATFVFDPRFTQNCQKIYADSPNGFKVSVSSRGARGSSTTRYVPNGDKYSTFLSGSYEIDQRTSGDDNTLTVKIDVEDTLKWPRWIDCQYVMTRVEEEGPSFFSMFAGMDKLKLGFMVIVLLTCMGLVCSKTQHKAAPMAVQQGGIQSYQPAEQFYQPQAQTDVYYNQQGNVY